MFTLNSLLSGTRSCLVTSGPVKIGLGKCSLSTLFMVTIFIDALPAGTNDRVTSLHVLDLPELACPGRLEDGPHVLFHQTCVKRDRHVPKLHVQLRILGGGETTVDMLPGDPLHVVQAGGEIQDTAEND